MTEDERDILVTVYLNSEIRSTNFIDNSLIRLDHMTNLNSHPQYQYTVPHYLRMIPNSDYVVVIGNFHYVSIVNFMAQED
jgi:hypothetical protein